MKTPRLPRIAASAKKRWRTARSDPRLRAAAIVASAASTLFCAAIRIIWISAGVRTSRMRRSVSSVATAVAAGSARDSNGGTRASS